MTTAIPVVSICCITYNHEKYIRNTLEGFIIQKTTFPVEIIIHDDASTDNTPKIILEFANKYPKIFFPIFQNENQYGKNKGRMFYKFVFPHVRGKYIALCEGDDYWTDPLKLQKQVNFLEENNDYGLVHTDLDQYDTVKDIWIRGLWKKYNRNKISGDIYMDLLYNNSYAIYLCTMCIRSSYVVNNKDYDDVMSQKFMFGDVPLYLHVARLAKIGYLPESTAVRNVLNFSATQGRDFHYMMNFRKTIYSIFQYFNAIRPFKISYSYVEKKQRETELDLCFSFKKKNEFIELYQKTTKSTRNYKIYIQRFGINNKFTHMIAKILIKFAAKLPIV